LVEEIELGEACKRCVEHFNKNYQTSIMFNVIGTEQLISNDVKKAICYIMREALYNVIKHAKASSTSVSLHYEDDAVKLIICDDGKGFDVRETFTKAEEEGSLGLFGMKDKAENLGGSLKIVSDVKKGTRVEFVASTKGNPNETS